MKGQAALGALFFVSGAAGLLYEVVWVRALGLIVGGEAVASQAVLSAYFTGMALGALVLGRRLDRVASPFAAYAALELAIALSGIYSLGALALADRVVPHLTTGTSGPSLGLVAYSVALAAFLPATFFMGATLPLLVRGAASSLAETPRAVGRLYAVNTLGAVAGSLATGFALLALIGARATVAVAVLLNAATALGAWLLARTAAPPAAPQDAPKAPALLPQRPLLAALVLAGFGGIAFEIAAVRVLAATFDSTVYSFAATLGSYLAGIAIAGALAARFPRLASGGGRPALLLGAAALAMAGAGQLLRLSGPLHAALGDSLEETWRGTMLAETLTALVLVLPAAIPTTLVFCGLAPLVVRSSAQAARGVGAATMANTAGCALAPLLVGLAIVPLDGSRGALRAAVAALAVAAAVAWRTLRPAGARTSTPAPLALAAIAVAVAVSLPSRLHSWSVADGQKLLHTVEGAGAVVAVEERAGSRLLRSGNQYFEGGEGSVFAEKRQGHLPMLLHPAPRRALVLGIGTGTTLGAVAAHPDVEVDGVELLAEVLEVLPYFSRANGDVLARRAARFYHADARSFVRAAAARGRRYDVVVADLYHPQQSGVGNLYTREHFAAIRTTLSPGGVFVQWLSLYELPPEDLATIVRTFLHVFPSATGWYAHFNARTGILGLAGGAGPLGLDWDASTARITASPTRAVVTDTMLDRPMELFGSFVTPTASLVQLAGAGPLNTDDRPLLEYTVPRRHGRADLAQRLRSLGAVMSARALPEPTTLRYGADPDTARDRMKVLSAHQLAIDALIRGQRASALGDNLAAAAAYQEGYQAAPEFRVSYYLLRDLGVEQARAGRTAESRRILRWLAAREPQNLDLAEIVARLGAAAP